MSIFNRLDIKNLQRIIILCTAISFMGCHITIMFALSEGEQFQTMLNMGMEEESSAGEYIYIQEIDVLDFDANGGKQYLSKGVMEEKNFYNEPLIDNPLRPPQI